MTVSDNIHVAASRVVERTLGDFKAGMPRSCPENSGAVLVDQFLRPLISDIRRADSRLLKEIYSAVWLLIHIHERTSPETGEVLSEE